MLRSSCLLLPLLALGCGSTSPAPPAPPESADLVRVNTVGYQPARGKRATYAGDRTRFLVVRAEDDETVFEGQAGPEIQATDSGEMLRVADFRDVAEPGEYYVRVPGLGRSPTFRIGEDVYVEPFRAAMLGMHGQRCGSAVSFTWQDSTFSHGECHTEDEAPFGWHDAGDFGKYTNNGALSLGVMLLAWEHFQARIEAIELDIPERGGSIPDFLDECRHQVEWLLAMQNDDGGVSDRTSASRFEPVTTMPENGFEPRPLAPVSTVATADFAAVIARAARAFEPYDSELAERCRTAALDAWTFLQDQTEVLPIMSMGFTGTYRSPSVNDDLFWAAAEIFELTGDDEVLALVEAEDSLPMRREWDWSELQNLGFFSYLGSTREGRDPARVDAIAQNAIVTAAGLAQIAEGHAYGRALGITYYWGINGVIARTVTNLAVAHGLEPNDALLDAGTYQLDHLFGRNYFGRSFVTGLGHRPPAFPHHRPSAGDSVEAPWPGLLVGGPSEGTPIATQWIDETEDFRSNEVAINWNAALVYALAAYLP
jgi:endoglucanase